MCKALPLTILENWMTEFINPQVDKVGVLSKQATNFGSTGTEIYLSPKINKKITGVDKNLTVAEFPDNILAEMLQHEQYKVFIEEVATLSSAPSEEFKKETAEKYPPPGFCSLFLFLSYPGTDLFLKFKKFNMKFDAAVFSDYKVVTQFLFYKAKFMDFELSSTSTDPKLILQEKNTRDLYKKKYLWFLIELLSKVASF